MITYAQNFEDVMIARRLSKPDHRGFYIDIGAGHRLTRSASSASGIFANVKERTIDFMKIDVEGGELGVLQDADWRKYRPRLLIVEPTAVNAAWLKTWFRATAGDRTAKRNSISE